MKKFRAAVGILIIFLVVCGLSSCVWVVSTDPLAIRQSLYANGTRTTGHVTRGDVRRTKRGFAFILTIEYKAGQRAYTLEEESSSEEFEHLRSTKAAIDVTYLPSSPDVADLTSGVTPVTWRDYIRGILVIAIIVCMGIPVAQSFAARA